MDLHFSRFFVNKQLQYCRKVLRKCQYIYGTPFTLFINIQKHEYINAHGKYLTDLGPIMRKARPSNAENESDISTLEKEIR